MNRHAFYHLNESNYAFALDKNTLRIRLRTARDDKDIDHIELIWNLSFRLREFQNSTPMEIAHEDELYSYYEATLVSNDPRFSYIFKVYLKDGSFIYYCEKGFVKDFDFKENDINAFKFAYINEMDISYNKDKFDGQILYQIFPERFLKGSKKIDKSYVNEPWDTKDLKACYKEHEHGVFLGGDLEGIIKKLDYLKSLNIGILYMTPICKSSSNHKYDVEDYFQIDPMFGNDKILHKLVEEAHKRDIKVVLDLVFNHSSNKNPMFLDVVEKGKKSKYYKFYMIDCKTVDLENKNYQTFGNVSRMPKLNTNNYTVQNYLIKVGKYFLKEFKVDGYRLDVANEVSHAFWQKFKATLRKIDKNVILIGEIWTNSYKFLGANELDTAMNYGFLEAAKDFFVRRTIDAEGYKNRLESLYVRYDENTSRHMVNLLDSHDTPRFYNFLNPYMDRCLLAELVLITHAGIPMIYYGDEIFMTGGSDPDNRRGMEWDSDVYNYRDFDLFKKITKLRNYDAIKNGQMKLDSDGELFILTRYNDKETFEIIINNTDKEIYHPINGKNILANKYWADILYPYSFVVVKR